MGIERLHRWALNIGRTPPPDFQEFRETAVGIWSGFETPVLDVPITLFRAHIQVPDQSWDMGWSESTSDSFEVVDVRGYHPYMFLHPLGQTLVDALTERVVRMEQRLFADG